MGKHALAYIDGSKRTDIFSIPFSSLDSEIVIQDWNPRDGRIGNDQDDLDLKEFIKAGNSIPPLGVSKSRISDKDVLVLINGHRRIWALKEAKKEGAQIERVGIQVLGKNINQADMLALTMADNRGKPLSRSEKADACKKLLNWGWEIPEIAKKIGENQATIRNLLKESSGSKELKEMLDNKEIPASETRNIIEKSGGDIDKEKELIDNFKQEKKEGKRTPTGKKKKRATIDLSPGMLVNEDGQEIGESGEAANPQKPKRKPLTPKQLFNTLQDLKMIKNPSEKMQGVIAGLEVAMGGKRIEDIMDDNIEM